MSISELFSALGPGVAITYLAEEASGEWWCEIRLPLDRYATCNAEASGTTADGALMNTIARAGTFRRQEERVA